MAVVATLMLGVTSDLILTMMIAYPLAMNKDFLNGKSIGKRISNIQVQAMDDGKAQNRNVH